MSAWVIQWVKQSNSKSDKSNYSHIHIIFSNLFKTWQMVIFHYLYIVYLILVAALPHCPLISGWPKHNYHQQYLSHSKTGTTNQTSLALAEYVSLNVKHSLALIPSCHILNEIMKKPNSKGKPFTKTLRLGIYKKIGFLCSKTYF